MISKKITIKSFSLLTLVTLIAAMLTSCGLHINKTKAGYYSVMVMEPRKPLIPGNTTETEGTTVIMSLFTSLVNFDEKGNLEYSGSAKSITSKDSKKWIIKLKPNWKFHDGTDVTAQSFIDAWNYNALSKNVMATSSFFNNIQGFEELQGENPTADTLSGLKYIDKDTFEVNLISPQITFPLMMKYNAFFPYPKVFFEDPVKYGKHPIGNGPFMAENDWVMGSGILVKRFEDYVGENKAKSAGIEFRVYTSVDTAYLDTQAGILDFMIKIPDFAIETYNLDFPKNHLVYETGATEGIAFPMYDKRFQDKRVRQAFSLAIDKVTLLNQIFKETAHASTDFVPPVVPGYKENGCTYCNFDPARAKELLAQTDFDKNIPVKYYYNANAGNDTWMLAIANQIKQNLGINFEIAGNLQFAQYLEKTYSASMYGGVFRNSWIMDYPGIDNFFSQLYSTSAIPPAGANTSFYSNPTFDDLLRKGLDSKTFGEFIKHMDVARKMLSEEIPVIPIFYKSGVAVWNKKLSNIYVNTQQQLDYANVVVD